MRLISFKARGLARKGPQRPPFTGLSDQQLRFILWNVSTYVKSSLFDWNPAPVLVSVFCSKIGLILFREATQGCQRPQGFLPHWTNSILQQLKRNFWKIADALFRIST
jgi:hypothetical protein